MQREMLMAKKERLESLITSIDRILKGENRMDFEVFSKNELEDMYNAMEANISEAQKNIFIEHYGSTEAWKKLWKHRKIRRIRKSSLHIRNVSAQL